MSSKDAVNCNHCRHFYITFDPAFPYGCRMFKIKSKHHPSREVRLADGKECAAFEAKNAKKAAPREIKSS